MSEAFYNIGGLRFWTQEEILVREQAVQTLLNSISTPLQALNSAWSFHRMEGPILTPSSFINAAYDETDIFQLAAPLGGAPAALRAETTASSYLYAEHLLRSGKARPPLCVWQVGKSFRRETNDGARASELRFNEFYQAEFQCIFKNDTKADIRGCVEEAASKAIQRITLSNNYRIVDSDRLPSYSTMTRDVEVEYNGKWKEMASISTRTDFPMENMLVCEVAVGLDRLVVVSSEN